MRDVRNKYSHFRSENSKNLNRKNKKKKKCASFAVNFQKMLLNFISSSQISQSTLDVNATFTAFQRALSREQHCLADN